VTSVVKIFANTTDELISAVSPSDSGEQVESAPRSVTSADQGIVFSNRRGDFGRKSHPFGHPDP